MDNINPLNGIWYSSVGSKLLLEVNGPVLTGKFDSTQVPNGFVSVFGSVANVNPNPDFLPMAFSASWPADGDYGPSVTSYSGQYTNINGFEQIDVIFILANQEESNKLWKSTSIGWDVFTRTK